MRSSMKAAVLTALLPLAALSSALSGGAQAAQRDSTGTRGGGELVAMEIKLTGLKMLYSLQRAKVREVAGVNIDELTHALSEAEIRAIHHWYDDPAHMIIRHLNLRGRFDTPGMDVSPVENRIEIEPEFWNSPRDTSFNHWSLLHLAVQLLGFSDDGGKRSIPLLEAIYPLAFPGESLERQYWYRQRKCIPLDKAALIAWTQKPSAQRREETDRMAARLDKGPGNCPEIRLADLPPRWLEDWEGSGSVMEHLANLDDSVKWSRSPELGAPLVDFLAGSVPQARLKYEARYAAHLLWAIRPQDPQLARQLLELALTAKLYEVREAARNALAGIRPADPEIRLALARALPTASRAQYEDDQLELAETLGSLNPTEPEILQTLIDGLEVDHGTHIRTQRWLDAIGNIRPRDPEILRQLEAKLAVLRTHPENDRFDRDKARLLKIDWLDEK